MPELPKAEQTTSKDTINAPAHPSQESLSPGSDRPHRSIAWNALHYGLEMHISSTNARLWLTQLWPKALFHVKNERLFRALSHGLCMQEAEQCRLLSCAVSAHCCMCSCVLVSSVFTDKWAMMCVPSSVYDFTDWASLCDLVCALTEAVCVCVIHLFSVVL